MGYRSYVYHQGSHIPSQEALDEWLNEQNFPPAIREKISQGVPPTKRMANDVIIALDLQIRRTNLENHFIRGTSGRSSSSTPCFADGKIFAVGGDRLFCVEAENGKLLWKQDLEPRQLQVLPLL